jgi:hypothetical protein
VDAEHHIGGDPLRLDQEVWQARGKRTRDLGSGTEPRQAVIGHRLEDFLQCA